MASKGIPRPIIDAFEAQVLHRDLPSLTDEDARRFTKMNWRTLCDAWHLAAVDHLLNQEAAYPATSRVLPTKLGNLIRATEDTLEKAAGDVEGSPCGTIAKCRGGCRYSMTSSGIAWRCSARWPLWA
jgi:hypothetical protein